MYPLLETIKVEKRKLHLPEYHNRRLNQARKVLWGVTEEDWNLEELIQIPDDLGDGVYKCRVMYGRELEKVEFLPYVTKSIGSLKLVKNDFIEYGYKYAYREKINELFAKRGECDDILIVKNGLITDTSYCNIAFYDGERWITPNTPLLNGCKRQYLVEKGLIYEQKITPKELRNFQRMKLFNAMMEQEHPVAIES